MTRASRLDGNGGKPSGGFDPSIVPQIRTVTKPTEKDIAEWHQALLNSEDALERFIAKRGIGPKSIKDFKIGWVSHIQVRGKPWRDFYTLPIRSSTGRLINVRCYSMRPGSKTEVWSWAFKDFDPAAVFPVDVLEENGALLVCEGEWDAIIANQEGIPAVTGTTGAENWTAKWNQQFKGKDVYIAYDRDNAGVRGARKVADNLQGVALSVRIVELPFPLVAKHGEDITDFFLKYGKDTVDLEELMESAPLAEDVNWPEPVESQESEDNQSSYDESWNANDLPPVTRTLLNILALRPEKPLQVGPKEWKVCCPFPSHNDRHRESARIWCDDNRPVYFRCFVCPKEGQWKRFVEWAESVGKSEDDLTVPPGDELEEQIAQEMLRVESEDRDHSARWLTEDEVFGLPPIEYVVDGLAQCAEVTAVWGEPGVMKTFLALGIAKAVSRGADFLGQKTEPGAVLFYAGEGMSQSQDRLDAINEKMNWERGSGAVRYLQESVDLTTVKGVAAVIRTARELEDATWEPVRLVVFDPLVEFMSGDENGDGMDKATRGLRVIAHLMNAAVVVIHHSNAQGQRERGSLKLKIRVAAMAHLERLPDGLLGLDLEKQRNGERLAWTVIPTPQLKSLVLEKGEKMSHEEYASNQRRNRRDERAIAKAGKRTTTIAVAESLLVKSLERESPQAKGKLLRSCLGEGVGKEILEMALEGLAGPDGRIGVRDEGKAQLHFLKPVEKLTLSPESVQQEIRDRPADPGSIRGQ